MISRGDFFSPDRTFALDGAFKGQESIKPTSTAVFRGREPQRLYVNKHTILILTRMGKGGKGGRVLNEIDNRTRRQWLKSEFFNFFF